MSTLIGLDIGTTSISAVAAEVSSGALLRSVTVPNDGILPSPDGVSRLQDPVRIVETALGLKESLAAEFSPVAAIGVTGQMHGILYLDRAGRAVSPLYTWQDGRGNLPYGKSTYAAHLSTRSCYPLASGFGLVTHFINREQSLVPSEAVTFCTIQDYIALLLARRKTPLLHASDAASFGCFDLEAHTFDRFAMEKLGFDNAFLPAVTAETAIIGQDGSIPVAAAIGDNQASVLGSLRENADILVNIGTGSQVSAVVSAPVPFPAGAVRPYVDGKFLLAGSPLCGGRAYAMLHRFFARCAELFGGDGRDIYTVMNDMAAEQPEDHSLTVDTRFCGTRNDPALRGALSEISEDNFTPEQLTRGVLWGMTAELRGLYGEMPLLSPATGLVGSGNAVRKNPVLRRYLEEQFNLPLKLPVHREEAAFGAAVFAAAAAGVYRDIPAAQSALLHYESKPPAKPEA